HPPLCGLTFRRQVQRVGESADGGFNRLRIARPSLPIRTSKFGNPPPAVMSPSAQTGHAASRIRRPTASADGMRLRNRTRTPRLRARLIIVNAASIQLPVALPPCTVISTTSDPTRVAQCARESAERVSVSNDVQPTGG